MGDFLIFAAFVTAFLSSVLFFFAYFKKDKLKPAARFFFHASVVMVIMSSAYLLYLIISHQFQYTYVWSYSSTELPIHLLLSSFYAGQEGSFHLWGLFTAIIGLFLLSFIIKKDSELKVRFEAVVMGVFMLIQTFIIFSMILKSPYMLIWESFPGEVSAGFMPQDGRGLNPILQNFWMAIHPPILFIGFAAMAIPFSFAIAALMKNEYRKWLTLVMPWVLFAAMSLGAGIMIGGFWAYEVLGWGGYWGWDPVENASLVPWILIVAAIHTITSENRTDRLKKISLFLCITAFVMVLYSTFLTRSGILGDASVHSFADPGNEVYTYLIIFMALFGGGGIALMLSRLKQLKPTLEAANILSRETALLTGAVTLCLSALVIAVGTSYPIFASGTIEPAFYNQMNLPVAILIAFINGFSLLLKWKHSGEKEFIKSLYVPAGISLVVTGVLAIFGLRDLTMVIFAGASIFALIINSQIAFKLFMKNNFKAGVYVTHMGLMILFLGIIGSSKYSEEVNISLPINQTKEAFGYELTYKGATPVPRENEKYHFNIVVTKENKSFLLQPIMYYSDYSDGIMKNPDIANLIFKDLYITPMSLEMPSLFEQKDIVNLEKGKTVEFKDMEFTFLEFGESELHAHSDNSHNHADLLKANVEVTLDGKKEKITLMLILDHGTPEYIPVSISGDNKYSIYLEKMNLNDDSSISIAIVDNASIKNVPAETFVLTASIKPFINLVWGGTIFMMVGFFFSMYARVRRKNKVVVKETE